LHPVPEKVLFRITRIVMYTDMCNTYYTSREGCIPKVVSTPFRNALNVVMHNHNKYNGHTLPAVSSTMIPICSCGMAPFRAYPGYVRNNRTQKRIRSDIVMRWKFATYTRYAGYKAPRDDNTNYCVTRLYL